MTEAPGVGAAPRARVALAVLVLGAAMMMLDTTIVNVALPTLRDSINASESTLSWVVSGYALACGLTLIPAGRLGDRIGHKWVFLAGIGVFTAASLWCGLAADGTWLVVARVVQGLGGGLFFPAIGAFIQLLFTGRSRGHAFAVLGATMGVFTALGPLAGGLLIEGFGATDGWRWIFFVNIPFGILAVAGAAALLPRLVEGDGERGFDGLGLALVTVGIVAVLVPLIQGEEAGWPAWTWGSMGAGVVVLMLFARWEVARSRRRLAQLVPPRLFAHRSFTGGAILALVFFASFTSIFFVFALYWQAGLDHTALETGLAIIPFSAGLVIGAGASARLAPRLGRGILALGTGCALVGLAGLWLIVAATNPAAMTHWLVLAPLAVAGYGTGSFIAPNIEFIVATVPRAEAGAAQGVLNTMQRLGAALGIAAVGTILFATLDTAAIASAFAGGSQTAGKAALAAAFTTSASWAFLAAWMCMALAFALVWTLPRRAAGGAKPAVCDAPMFVKSC
jgi:EmrB/QacA subfamily drug resistance transporter